MDRRRRLRLVMFAVLAAALMSVSLIVLIQQQPRTVKEAYGTYSMDPTIDLVDKLKKNSLYGNNSELINPSTIYTNITSNLSVDILIYFQDTDISHSPVEYNYTVTIISTAPSWTHLSYYQSGLINTSSGDTYSVPIGLNVSSNVSMGRNINQQLGFGSSGQFSLLFGITLVSEIGTSRGNMTLTVGSITDSLTSPSYLEDSGVIFKNVVLPGRIIIPIKTDYAYPLLAISAMFFALAALQIERKKKTYLEKFKAENQESIVELNSGPPDGSIEVRSSKDILRMAALLERPAFWHDGFIFVEMDGKTYYAEIKYEN